MDGKRSICEYLCFLGFDEFEFISLAEFNRLQLHIYFQTKRVSKMSSAIIGEFFGRTAKTWDERPKIYPVFRWRKNSLQIPEKLVRNGCFLWGKHGKTQKEIMSWFRVLRDRLENFTISDFLWEDGSSHGFIARNLDLAQRSAALNEVDLDVEVGFAMVMVSIFEVLTDFSKIYRL